MLTNNKLSISPDALEVGSASPAGGSDTSKLRRVVHAQFQPHQRQVVRQQDQER